LFGWSLPEPKQENCRPHGLHRRAEAQSLEEFDPVEETFVFFRSLSLLLGLGKGTRALSQ